MLIKAKQNFNAANNNQETEYVAKIYVILKTPENDPLMILRNPKINPSFVIKVKNGQTKENILLEAQAKMDLDKKYDATIMMEDANGGWSYKTTNTVNSRFDVMNVILKHLHDANTSGKIQIRNSSKAPAIKAA